MRKLGLTILLVVSVVLIASQTFAQCAGQSGGSQMPMGKGMMMEMGKEGDMSPMTGMMKMQGNIVATGDGGVVVLIGNRLYKYDKNLNLQKEVEIMMDMKAMHKMTECPATVDEKAVKPAAPEDKSGHELHHH